MQLLRITVALLVTAATACTLDVDDPEAGSIGNGAIVANRLLDDGQLEGSGTLDAAGVQTFLRMHGSALADYSEGGRSAARSIVRAARLYDIDEIYLLARIETESGLIRSGTLNNLSAATGCGCPDGSVCDPNLAGFGLQVECAAQKMRGYLDDLDWRGTTISGWAVGKRKRTLDPCWVVPANRATAALYTYTPWVGAYADDCGTSRWGGSSLVALLYRRFSADLPDLGDMSIVIDSNNGRNDPSVARVEYSSSWTPSNATAGYHGTGYAYASTQAISDPASFWFYLPEDGEVTIEAWWTAGGNRSAAAPFIIQDASGSRVSVVRLDQRTGGSRWNSLGSFQLTAGWNRVMLSRWTTPGSVVIADAIRVR